jgi:hypothetical protein
MADEMDTPRPVILITDEKSPPYVVHERKLFFEDLMMGTSLVFDTVFEAWRQVHRIRMGVRDEYPDQEEYMKALEDPYPYEESYIFYCLGK